MGFKGVYITRICFPDAHHYQLDESTFTFRGVRSDFYFLSQFSMKFLCANRIAPDGMAVFERGVTSGAMLFAYVPQKGLQAYMSYLLFQVP